jgi:transcriptional antiterminator NusG
METMTKKWFVIHTYSGHENKVKNNLERAIKNAGMEDKFGRILVAMEEHAEMRDGQRVVTKRKTFPSYVIVEMVLDSETQVIVAGVPGVTRFVGSGQDPVPLNEEEVDRILGRLDTTKPREPLEVPYKVGEHVKVTDGPFTDFTGVVDEVNGERGKLKVMVSIFGRATPVELDFLQVKPV